MEDREIERWIDYVVRSADWYEGRQADGFPPVSRFGEYEAPLAEYDSIAAARLA